MTLDDYINRALNKTRAKADREAADCAPGCACAGSMTTPLADAKSADELAYEAYWADIHGDAESDGRDKR